VFSDEVHGHIPLTAIADGIIEHEPKGAVIDGTIGAFDDGFKKVIGPFEFVPEVDVGLAKLELFEVHFSHGTHPKEIQRSEQPASTASVLRRDSPVIEPGAKGIVHRLDTMTTQRKTMDIVSTNGILSHTRRRIRVEGRSIGIDLSGRDIAGHTLSVVGRPL
jgi:hypothetical protein